MNIVYKCLPTAGGILATVAAQESARRAVASSYGVELSPPFLLPAWPFPSVGCLGAVTRRLTPAPNREAEYAMSLAAAVSGLVVSFGLIAAGAAAGPETDPVVNLNYQLLPVFLRVLLKPLLGTASISNQPDPFMDPINIAYPANPLLIGGIVGLIIVSLSLLPIGRLDGGVLARTCAGSRAAGPLGLLGFVLLILGSFAPDDAGTLYLTFGLTTLIWQNGSEMPPREAVKEIGDGQKALGAVLLLVGFLLSIPGWAFPTV
jgi:membrane-associated protease RseP (regulator of RpoE activity)